MTDMEFYRPASLAEALEYKADNPAAMPISGGTDLMVELNFDVHRPAALLDLNPLTELAQWSTDGDHIRVGACVSYTRIIAELGEYLPGLAIAARTVGSPQIRNRGTLGGNLGAASPAGDGHPPLLAEGARIELSSSHRTRLVPVGEFFTGVKRSVLQSDELITAIVIPAARGPQQFSKIGTRNAMVIAVCAFALSLNEKDRKVGTGIGSAAPTPLPADQAESFLAGELDWENRSDITESVVRHFSELVAAATSPIDDVRGSAAYRRHALSVMAGRTLRWAWKEYQCA